MPKQVFFFGRYIINHMNVTVEYKKKPQKRKSSKVCKRRNTEHLYAPPSYEVVVGMDEAPPPYYTVADEQTDSDSDEDHGVLIEQNHESSPHSNAKVVTPETESNSLEHGGVETTSAESHNVETPINGIKVTSAIVVCDVEGNFNCQTKLAKDADVKNADFESLTNLKMCSPSLSNEVEKRKKSSAKELPNIDEIEVLASGSDDSHSTNDENENRTKRKGKAIGNPTPLSNGKLNGHAVSYHRSPSKREAGAIEFIDSD